MCYNGPQRLGSVEWRCADETPYDPRYGAHASCYGILTLSGANPRNLDPGTGSCFIPIALAALAGVLFAVRLLWRRIKASFQKLFSRRIEDEEQGGQYAE